MAKELSSSAQKIQTLLQTGGFSNQVVELADSTRTAKDAAQAVGCEVAQIVKSLVFKGKNTKKAIFVVVSGSNRVNEKKLSALVGEPIEKADADFVRQKTGFAIGGVAPLGHTEALETYVDEDLLRLETIWAAAGTPFAVFQLTPKELLEMTGGQIVPIA